MHKFPGTTFDNIEKTFEQYFFDYNNILISMKKDAEHIINKWLYVLYTWYRKQRCRVFRHAAVQSIFGNTGGSVLKINPGVTIWSQALITLNVVLKQLIMFRMRVEFYNL